MDESATQPGGDADGADVALRPAGGRHHWLRRRMATASPPVASLAPSAAPPAPVSDTPDDTDEPATEVVATADAETSTDETAAEQPTDAADAPPAKRRKWLVRRRSSAPAAEPAPEEPTEDLAEPAEEVETTDPPTAEAEATGGEPKKTQRRQLRKWHVGVAASAAVLFVGSASFTGAMLQPYLADRAVVDIKMDIARTAANAITTFWTYTPADMDQLPARAAPYLGGNLKENFLKQVDAFVAASKQYQVSRNTEVVGAAVESLDGPNAMALVYANIVYTSSATKGVPTFNLTAFRLQMHRTSDGWVITGMPTITSKDASQIAG